MTCYEKLKKLLIPTGLDFNTNSRVSAEIAAYSEAISFFEREASKITDKFLIEKCSYEDLVSFAVKSGLSEIIELCDENRLREILYYLKARQGCIPDRKMIEGLFAVMGHRVSVEYDRQCSAFKVLFETEEELEEFFSDETVFVVFPKTIYDWENIEFIVRE